LTTPIPAPAWFLAQTQVCFIGISIGSAVFAGLIYGRDEQCSLTGTAAAAAGRFHITSVTAKQHLKQVAAVMVATARIAAV